MSRRTYDEGWQACLEAIDNIRQNGSKTGKHVAHLSQDQQTNRRLESFAYECLSFSVPYKVREWAFNAGFEEGVAKANAEARRIGLLIEQQKQADAPNDAKATKK